MHEDRDTGLINPVLHLNGAQVSVQDTIPYDHYLVYSEGLRAKVYGPNWRFVKDVPVTIEGDFVAKHGNNAFSVASKSPNTWLSSRIKVKDNENVIRIDKPNDK